MVVFTIPHAQFPLHFLVLLAIGPFLTADATPQAPVYLDAQFSLDVFKVQIAHAVTVFVSWTTALTRQPHCHITSAPPLQTEMCSLADLQAISRVLDKLLPKVCEALSPSIVMCLCHSSM
eukprot:6210550-Pleurochrysis_carterae.AAC.1